MFRPVDPSVSFPQLETDILAFWKEQRIYEKSLAQREGAQPFVFYEGPPTANGMPHPGHCLTRAIKDLFPRYRTMRGDWCQRKGGWDTHGLPVEVEVCKELGIHSKEEIEQYGVEPFIQLCQKSVWRYMQEWERLTERLGFWIHLDEAYVTYHQSYVESVWWSLKNLFDRGLLYEGHKIVWWWAQGGTALSSGEVGLGYREVADPSVYVRFPLLDDDGNETDTSLLVWTTTPWTLPSNQFAAVHPELEYVTLHDAESNRKYIVAQGINYEKLFDRAKVKLKQGAGPICKGSALVGRRYHPPFDYYFKTLGEQKGKLYPTSENNWREGLLTGMGLHGEHLQRELAKSEDFLAWRIVPADFVTTDTGTGVVHQAPAFGEVDYDVLLTQKGLFHGEGPELINAVGPDGKFTSEAPDYQGRWVKDCDKDITRNLKERGLLFHQEQYLHEYPFCWRAEQDPLIQYPRKSWFIRTTQYKDRMLENNRQINWLPEHIKEGRFGNFLESNVDWALSRERFWGTPLPIWVCEQTGKMEAVGSYAELLEKPGATGTDVWEAAKEKNPELVDDLKVHKPYIDAVTYDSPFADGARMRRVTEVIDCWYDSGAMPLAQWGYPHQRHEKFQSQFPADFISEALDQTRGWFYSLLAISTLLFSTDGEDDKDSETQLPKHPYPHPYRACIVLGLMLGEDGQKMSKSKRNYREPAEIFDKYGADALRWYFFANQPPWTSIRYSEQAIKDSIPGFLLRLWNCYSFFIIYANSEDRFDPSERIDGEVGQLNSDALARGDGYRPPSERREMDRWILSEMNRTAVTVVERMDAYDNFGACKALDGFVDNLSNWYVRRSRPRYWSKQHDSPDKLDAYWTLYECLLNACKLIAPFTPFLADGMWRNLAGVFGERAVESVHLCDFPEGDADVIDETLSQRMDLGRLIVSLGLQARASAKLKVRQPLAKVEVILADPTHQGWLESHRAVVAEELNVKEVEFPDDPDKYIEYQIVPNFKLLGPKLGKLMPKVKKWLGEQTGAELLANLRENGRLDVEIDGQPVELTREEVEVRITGKQGWTAANDRGCVVVLSTELTPELIGEGYARDIVRLVNDERKQRGCQFTDHIELAVVTGAEELRQAIADNADYIKTETQADALSDQALEGVQGSDQSVGDFPLTIYLRVV